MLVNINQDMVGARQSWGGRVQYASRLPWSLPHALDDVMESVLTHGARRQHLAPDHAGHGAAAALHARDHGGEGLARALPRADGPVLRLHRPPRLHARAHRRARARASPTGPTSSSTPPATTSRRSTPPSSSATRWWWRRWPLLREPRRRGRARPRRLRRRAGPRAHGRRPGHRRRPRGRGRARRPGRAPSARRATSSASRYRKEAGALASVRRLAPRGRAAEHVAQAAVPPGERARGEPRARSRRRTGDRGQEAAQPRARPARSGPWPRKVFVPITDVGQDPGRGRCPAQAREAACTP